MPYSNPKHKTRHQRQRRQAGEVKRVEIVLSADSDRDHEIYDFLASLPRGAAGEFIKQAIHEKMHRDQDQPQPAPAQSEANAQFAQLMQEIAAQRAEIAALRDVVQQPAMVAAEPAPVTDKRRRTQPEARPAPTPAPSAPEPVASSGIDMSRPRRRSNKIQQNPAPSVEPAPAELDDRARDALARELLRSIQGFGKGR